LNLSKGGHFIHKGEGAEKSRNKKREKKMHSGA